MAQSVTELLARLKHAVESQVGEQSVCGEVGSCKAATSGHTYFTLKDARAQLQCVLYRYAAASSKVRLREGMQVELWGKATVWEGRGSLQFTVSHVKEAGQGTLQQQFEQLKAKLKAEGLFEPSRKKRLPSWPHSVGLITSATGAVIEDMRHRLEARAPWMEAYLLPVQVQGKGAEFGLASAIEMWSNPQQYGLPEVDYLILARGGGSLEDLWCFNEEVLARAIAKCRIPIISAVGHETDFTIADFVSDLRAPTPTAAIELSTPDAESLQLWLNQNQVELKMKLARARDTARLRLRLIDQSALRNPQQALAPYQQMLDALEEELRASYQAQFTQAKHRLELADARLSTRSLFSRLGTALQGLDHAQERISQLAAQKIEREKAKLEHIQTQMKAASPQNALDRGFALVQNKAGKLIRSSKQLKVDDELILSLGQGKAHTQVKKIEP